VARPVDGRCVPRKDDLNTLRPAGESWGRDGDEAYYEKWDSMTLEHIDRRLVEIVPELGRFTPPARTFDKATYSPWMDGRLHRLLQHEGVNILAFTGGETDVCGLATVLGAVDLGYRVLLLRDAVCSGADETHDASLKLLGHRFSVQVQVLLTDEFLEALGSSRPARTQPS
jgi:nicotinamidase-related amidase